MPTTLTLAQAFDAMEGAELTHANYTARPAMIQTARLQWGDRTYDAIPYDSTLLMPPWDDFVDYAIQRGVEEGWLQDEYPDIDPHDLAALLKANSNGS